MKSFELDFVRVMIKLVLDSFSLASGWQLYQNPAPHLCQASSLPWPYRHHLSGLSAERHCSIWLPSIKWLEVSLSVSPDSANGTLSVALNLDLTHLQSSLCSFLPSRTGCSRSSLFGWCLWSLYWHPTNQSLGIWLDSFASIDRTVLIFFLTFSICSPSHQWNLNVTQVHRYITQVYKPDI